VVTYLAGVRAELSDLPPGELEDVLDDVTGHLTEVAAELGGEPTATALQGRLGTPRQYADELRTAAGYPPRTPTAEAAVFGLAALRWGAAPTGHAGCRFQRRADATRPEPEAPRRHHLPRFRASRPRR